MVGERFLVIFKIKIVRFEKIEVHFLNIKTHPNSNFLVRVLLMIAGTLLFFRSLFSTKFFHFFHSTTLIKNQTLFNQKTKIATKKNLKLKVVTLLNYSRKNTPTPTTTTLKLSNASVITKYIKKVTEFI